MACGCARGREHTPILAVAGTVAVGCTALAIALIVLGGAAATKALFTHYQPESPTFMAAFP